MIDSPGEPVPHGNRVPERARWTEQSQLHRRIAGAPKQSTRCAQVPAYEQVMCASAAASRHASLDLQAHCTVV